MFNEACLGEFQSMCDRQVDPAAIVTWRVQVWLTTLAIAGASAIPLVPLALPVALAVMVGVTVVGLAIGWYWPVARYRRLTYRIDPMGLTINDGVWWLRQIALPRARIQHSDVSQGPLQRRYGIATLKLYTAGSRYTKVELEGVRHEDALALRDRLLAREALSA